MLRFTFFLALILAVASCKEKKEKVIDLSERTPRSNRNYDAPDTASNINPNQSALTTFQSWNSEISAIRKVEKRSFLQRFRPDSVENYVWYLQNGDSISYQRTVFKDSVKTKSAFFNWLDHEDVAYFGANERIQKEAIGILYTDTMILSLSGAVDLKFWEEYFLEEEWLDEGDYWIKQRKFGKAQWFVREEDELKDLTDL